MTPTQNTYWFEGRWWTIIDRLIDVLGFRHSPHSDKQTSHPVQPLGLCGRGRCCSSSSLPHADVAPPNSVPLLPALGQCEGRAVKGGGVWLYPGKPETVDVGKVVAGSSRPLTLNKGLSPEVCQTAAWWCQRLTTPLITCTCMLQSQEMTWISSDMLHQQYTTLSWQIQCWWDWSSCSVTVDLWLWYFSSYTVETYYQTLCTIYWQ